MSSKADVESFEKLADRFEHLIQEEPDLSVEEAKKTIIRLGAMGARLWHRSGIELIKGFSPDRFNPKITHDSFKDEKLWWLTWQALVNVLATAYPHRIPGGVALSAGDVKLDEPGQDIPAYKISLPWKRWKSIAQDFAICCRLFGEFVPDQLGKVELLSDNERLVLDVIKNQEPGTGILGKQILSTLDKRGLTIDETDMRRRILPRLKRDYGVKNRQGVGYYCEGSTDPI